MDFSSLNPAAILVSLIIAATPLLFAALGELVVEKSGVLNLGVEGMMIVGAIGGFATALETQSLVLAILAGAAAGAALAAVFAIMTQYLLSNQVATGLALTMFGLGIASLLGQTYAAQTGVVASSPMPRLGMTITSPGRLRATMRASALTPPAATAHSGVPSATTCLESI